MKKTILTILAALSFSVSFSQFTVFSENFEPDPGWTTTSIGANGADPNFFVVNDNESGNVPPACGTAGGGDNSLHVTSVIFPAGGAAYDAGGFCGILSCPETATRVESSNISTVGQVSGLTLEFDYIMGGDANDYGGVWYNDGTGWTALVNPLPQTPNGCAPQGQWTNYTVALPASCQNIPNLQIGFSWVNNDDGAGSDPSFAIDDILIDAPTPPNTVACFTSSATTICSGETITFTDCSSGGISVWAWDFINATPLNANTQGPHTVTFDTPGTYNVSLSITSGPFNDNTTTSITVLPSPEAGNDNSSDLCNNTTLNLNTLLSGADAGGTWIETSGSPSGQFVTGTGILDGNGLTNGDVYTFDYTVPATGSCPADVSTFTITINCGAASLSASITTTPSTTTICEGTTLTFTDNSTASGTTITSWAWTFDGEAAASSTQNPPAVTFNTAGTYDIILTIGDGTLTNNFTQTVTVNAPSNAGNSNSANFCSNASPADAALDLNTLLGGSQDAGGTWVETSGALSGAFVAGTGMFDGNGLTIGNVYTFDYTVTGTIPCPDVTSTITITIIDCLAGNISAGFTPSATTICVGTTLTFTDASTESGTTITTWGWSFDGNTPISGQGSHDYTFNTPGSIDVVLAISDGTLNDTHTETFTVIALPTVTATASPSTTVCTGDQVTLTGGGAITYTWDNGVTNGTAFTPTVGSTTYTVTGTDANSCSNTESVTINVADCVPMIAGFSFNDNICAGSCINFTDTTSGSPVDWNWDFSTGATPLNSSVQNPENICFNTAGVYQIQLTVTDAAGNSVSTTNSITVFDLPTVSAQFDTIIDLGGNVELEASSPNIGNYLWTPDTYYIDCDTCSTAFATPLLDEDYIVIFTDYNGCSAQDTVSVVVNFIEGIGVPQAFSPNNDGQNDLLVVKGLGIDKMNFKIYNRYGQLVFEGTEQDHGWDGTFKGKDENPGVFVWVLEYKFLGQNNVNKQTGNTTLIR